MSELHPVFKNIAPPLSGLLLLSAFGFAVFFRGTDDVTFVPVILSLSGLAVISLWPGLQQGWEIPRSGTCFFAFLFLCYLIFAMRLSQVPFTSEFFTLIIGTLPATFFILILSPLRLRDKIIKYAVMSVGAGLSIMACWAVIQFFFLYELYGPRIQHPMLNPNNLGALLNVGLLSTAGMFVAHSKNQRLLWALSAVGVVVFSIAVLSTGGRGAFLSAAICLIALLFFVRGDTRKDKLKKIAALCGLLVIPFILMQDYSWLEHQKKTLEIMGLGIDVSLVDRQSLWLSTLDMMRDHLWMGPGLGTFFFYYPRYRVPADQSDGFFAHMDPLQFGAEIGVLAPVIFYALLIAILWRTIRAVRATIKNDMLRLHIITPFLAMLAVAGHTHISFHLYLLVTNVLLALALAYWYVKTEEALLETRGRFSVDGRAQKICGGAMLLLLLAIPLLWSVGSGIALYTTKKSENYIALRDVEKAKEYIDLTARWAPASYFHTGQYQARWYILQMKMHGAAMSAAEKKDIYDKGLKAINQGLALNPDYASLTSDRAKVYYFGQELGITDNGFDLAAADLERTVKNNPLSLSARMGLARIYKKKGRYKDALDILEKGLGWPRLKGQVDVDHLVMTARLRLRLGDQAGHDFLMRRAVERARSYGMIKNTAP